VQEIDHVNINKYKISLLQTTENYKGELETNSYLYSEATSGTRRLLLHLNSTSLRAKQEKELELAT